LKHVRDNKRITDLLKNNSGSTIVMVLVAFLFVSILVSIIMSTVAVNFKMRAIDRRTKDEFYYAEKALNDIYAGVGENCARALGDSYNTVMSMYSSNSGSYQDQVKAYDEFCIEYLKSIYSTADNSYGLYIKPSAIDKDKLISKMNGYIVDKRAKVTSIGDIKYLKSDKKQDALTDEDRYPGIKYTIIKNVKIVSDMTAAGNSGYISGVTADIVIETPQIDFFTVNEKDLDYAIAANDGIKFDGNAVIKGSVYGGARPGDEIKGINDPGITNIYDSVFGTRKYMTDSSDYGGILINGSNVTIEGEYVVSGGDIYVKNDGDDAGNIAISHDTKNEIWLDNLMIAGQKSNVNITGDVYAQGDLQVEGDGSNVVVKGSYYGYNDGSFESKTDKLTDVNGRNKANASSKFSSIIVNSKESTIDMTGLDTLVLLGKAYINHESKRTEDAASLQPLVDNYKTDSAKDDIGESVALRSGQGIFLCPSEFLKGKTNPAEFSDENFDFTVDKDAMRDGGWFGWKYLNDANPTKTVKLKKNGVNRAYCYLNFKGSNNEEINDNQRKYVEDIINKTSSSGSCEPSPETMYNRLIHSNKQQNSEILIGDDDTRIYAKGSVVQYDVVEDNDNDPETAQLGTISFRGNTTDFKRYSNYSKSMHYKYQRLSTYLDPMTNSTLSDASVTDVSSDDYESAKLPFGRLFWLGGIDKIDEGDAITSRAMGASGYEDYIEDCDSTVIVCHGRENGDSFFERKASGDDRYKSAVDIASVLNNNGNPTNVFMIIDGDAIVKDNVTINGFIYVSGELIVNKGATLNVTYNSTLLDKRIEAELKRLKEEYISIKNNPDDLRHTMIKPEDCYSDKTLIYYLLDYRINNDGSALSPAVDAITDSNVNNHRKYKIDEKTGDVIYDVTSDYTQFMHLDNWRKGL